MVAWGGAGVPAWPEGISGVPTRPEGATCGFVGVGTSGDFWGGAAIDGVLTARGRRIVTWHSKCKSFWCLDLVIKT